MSWVKGKPVPEFLNVPMCQYCDHNFDDELLDCFICKINKRPIYNGTSLFITCEFQQITELIRKIK
jgi:hypothetical protein